MQSMLERSEDFAYAGFTRMRRYKDVLDVLGFGRRGLQGRGSVS